MTSLRELKALFDLENAPSPNVANLTKRVELQRRALAQAEADLQVALGREPSPEPPRLPQPQPGGPRALSPEQKATADAIILAGLRRRGLARLDPPPVIRAAEPPANDEASAALAAAILAAGRARRGEKD